jgi:5'-3' exonuclease
MGIEKFNPFITEKAPGAFTEIPATYFANTVIVIDAHNYIYTNMYTALKYSLKDVNLRDDVGASHDNSVKMKTFLKQILRFIVNLTSYSITPVFVFDGPNIYGKVVREKRREANRKMQESKNKLEQTLEQISPLERTDEDIEELRRLKGAVNKVEMDEMNLFKDVLKRIGVPVIQADGDGEHICCMMVREGLATAVYSRDTDCMVYGCPLMVKRLYKPSGKRYHVFEVTQFAPILQSLRISYKSFVDLCIMAKCDYNINIPGIGMTKAFNLIKKFKSIEEIAEAKDLDIECLRHEFCRDQFRICRAKTLLYEPDHGDVIPPLVINKNALKTDDARRILRLYEADDMINPLVASYRNIRSVVNRTADKLSVDGRVICMTDRVNIIIKGNPSEPVEVDGDQGELENDGPIMADDPLKIMGLGDANNRDVEAEIERYD